MADMITRIDTENAFLDWVKSPLGYSLRDKCVELFSNELSMGQHIDFYSISVVRNVESLLNVYCDSVSYKRSETTFIMVFTFTTNRIYIDELLETDTSDNIWREPIRAKLHEFMEYVRIGFTQMLTDTGIKGQKKIEVVEVTNSEPPLQADSTIQIDMDIEISIPKCLIN